MKPYIFLIVINFFVVLHLSSAPNVFVNDEVEKLIDKSKEILFTNPEQSVLYAAKAIKLGASYEKEGQNNDQKVEAMLAYSLAEKLLGNFDSSIRMLYDALESVTPSNSTLQGRIYALMGGLYCSLTDYNKAIEFNDKATSIFKTTGDSASIALCYNNRGIIHYNLDEFNIAEQFFLQALSINRSLKLMKEVAGNLNNLTLYKGDNEKKIEYIKEAIVINKNLNAQWSLGENYNNLGKQYFYANQYDNALKALSKAFEIATSIGAKELICDNYEYSSWVYAAMGDYKTAYQSFEKLYLLSNELQSSNKLRSVEQDISNKRYLNQKRAAENKEQNYKIELLKRNIFILIVLIILLVTISLFFSKWYKRKKFIELMEARYMLEQSNRQLAELKLRQQKTELENAQKSLNNTRKELTTFAVFLQSKNDLLVKLRNMIRQGYKMTGDELSNHLKSLNLFIAQYQSMDKERNNILMNVEEKNMEFLQRLTKLHPDLTQGEKDLALLLFINLSTKEIALLTGKIPKTINMNRYRLRKSLNLSSSDNITEYLQNL
ncbi:tetratricopeptide repeat protein [Proteiniphilum sp. UBA5463]|jgi:tetratricopeptide (TPR) repeat protein|uniref:tetratricopeptide repeat protein n=1 Tax=Proteiniphilum sp. UBA5463 TaxID=1947281 RepID=UPI00257F27F1|nr:tetratricopeptide repeat protein [Proteiniphilum sp. UBA5463]